MQRWLAISATSLVLSCTTSCSRGSEKVARDELLGTWERWCRIDAPSQWTCLAKERGLAGVTFATDGTAVWTDTAGRNSSMQWSLDAKLLTLDSQLGDQPLSLTRTVQVRKDMLKMWSSAEGLGSIYARPGKAFVAPKSPQSTGAPIVATIGSITYQLDVPAGYRQVRDSKHAHEWEPGSGDGLAFRVKVSERAEPARRDGEPIASVPCARAERPLAIGSASSEKNGRECLRAVSTTFCVPGTESSISCWGSHTRGCFADEEEQAAAAVVCQSLVVPGD